ncbi:hypothetical protein [Acinetobacter silvestris]|uniref:Uncharacterized protein n=1 Tax=Acinetobacter silvestris TaxID=1977882 RepID=A0A1Y3CIA9_9GAMM|nr:hypothetical protein [Acinetobacter silvestris]OTG65837.1 hypothetical protein B9T28_06455 [Acinetobacter silvestris]
MDLFSSLTGSDVAQSTQNEPLDYFKKALELQKHLLEFEQVDIPVEHHFAPGNYARECFLPAGSVVIGKVHRHAHVNVISKGKVTVATSEGIRDYEAPITFISEPGTKRALIVHEDTVWTTVHPTDTQDLALIESDVIVPESEVEAFILSLNQEKIA